MAHVYDQERDDLHPIEELVEIPSPDLQERYEHGIAHHCGALAGAVESLLTMTATLEERLAARIVAQKTLDDYQAWIEEMQAAFPGMERSVH